jgi:hypothetical protein
MGWAEAWAPHTGLSGFKNDSSESVSSQLGLLRVVEALFVLEQGNWTLSAAAEASFSHFAQAPSILLDQFAKTALERPCTS